MRSMVLFFLLAPVATVGQGFRSDTAVTVNATRVSRIMADRFSAYVAVEGTAETPVDAMTRLQTKLKTVSDAIQSLTPRIVADPPVSYGVMIASGPTGYPGAPAGTSYIARAVIRVQGARLEQLMQLQSAALVAGATTTSGVMFESSVADSVRRSRIPEAVAAARADAEALAAAQGFRLGSIIDMNTSAFSQQNQTAFISFDSRYTGQQSPPPEITINTSVTVRFRLIR